MMTENANCLSCVVFNPEYSFPNGVLPTRHAIIETLLHIKDTASSTGQSQQASSSWLVSKDVVLHWIFCNVYPQTPNSVQYVVDSLWKEFQYLRDYPNKRKGPAYWTRYGSFISDLKLVPDFIELDTKRRKAQEKLWKCDMIDRDRAFHKQQIHDPPYGYCSSFIDMK